MSEVGYAGGVNSGIKWDSGVPYRMKKVLRHALSPVLFLVASAFGQDVADQVIPRVVLPNGNALLQAVRDRLPAEPITLKATLKTVTSVRSGPDEITRVKAESTMDFGADIPHGSYTIFDLKGMPIEKVVVEWVKGDARFTYFEGANLLRKQDFVSTQMLKNAPFTWYDLSLSFLWWPQAKTIAQSQKTIRKVWLVDLEPPVELRQTYSRVRLQIDQAETLVRAATVFDAQGEKIREIEMKGLQELDGIYMFKDMAIISWPGRVKTTILVKDLLRSGEAGEPVPPVNPFPRVP
jgi:hypothetical protein